MTREQAKELLPIIQAFAEGKTVEYLNNEKRWVEGYDLSFWLRPQDYRIKSDNTEQKYRPFKNVEECWEEIQNHQPVGWVKNKNSNDYISIASVYCSNEKKVRIEIFPRLSLSAEHAYNQFEFTDGTPFGIKEKQLWKKCGQQEIRMAHFFCMKKGIKK